MLDSSPLLPQKAPFREEIADLPRLRTAWTGVRAARGVPGIDGLGIPRVERDLDRALERVRRDLLARRYSPAPLLRVLVPKPAGGSRMIGIPTVMDRIVLGSAASALYDRVGGSFSPTSFAYRPGLGPRDAADRLAAAIALDPWAVIADIEGFFDNVDHRILLRLLRGAGLDRDGIELIAAWLGAPIVHRGFRLQPVKGICQGSPLSPVLANLYLHELDRSIEAFGWKHVRYADDFVILAKSETEARRILHVTGRWLAAERRLRIKTAKTLYVETKRGVDFVGFELRPGSRRIPDDKLEGFRSRITAALERPDRATLRDVVTAHDALVRGWRSYYGGAWPEIDQQLAELDLWRRQRVDAYLQAVGVDADLGELAFESLRRVRDDRVAPDDYTGAVAPSGPAEPAEVAEPTTWGDLQSAMRSAATQFFSDAKGLDSQAIAARQIPTTFHDGALHVPTHGAFLGYRGALLSVRRKKERIFECADDEVTQIILSGRGIAVSSQVILESARRDIPLVVCAGTGQPVARLVPVRSETRPNLLTAQIAARVGELGGRIAREIVEAKVRNQRALLLYHAKYPGRRPSVRTALEASATRIADVADAVRRSVPWVSVEQRQELLLLEARAGGAYWRAVRELVPIGLGFVRRHGRGASDPVNLLLNYGYWILATRVWLAIERAALHPFIGVLHTSRRGAPGLVFDLMEPFRAAVVDRAVFGLIGRGMKPIVRNDRVLSLRTRRLLEMAIERNLGRIPRRHQSETTRQTITATAVAFRDAVATEAKFHAYRMTW